MKRFFGPVIVLAVGLGCQKESPPTSARTSTPTSVERRETKPAPTTKGDVVDPSLPIVGGPATRQQPPAGGGLFGGPPVRVEPEGPPAEKRPDSPKTEANAEWTPLNPEKTLYLEMATGAEGKKKGTRVAFAAEVVMTEGPLEVFLCKTNTKEHEAILRTSIDARLIHAALLAAGAKPGAGKAQPAKPAAGGSK